MTKKNRFEIFLKSPIIVIIKRAIMLKIILNKKTSCNFENFYIDGY